MDRETNSDIEELQEQIDINSKLLNGYNDDLRVEQQKFLALMRRIIKTEDKIEQLEMRKRDLENEIRSEGFGKETNNKQEI